MMDRHRNGNPSETITDPDRHAEETHWIKAIRDGEKEVFRQMFEAYYDPLLRFAFRYVRSKAVAEGLVQNVFLWIWENRAEWQVEGSLRTYLFRAVKYKAMDYWRRERTRQRYMEQLSEEQESCTVPKVPNEPEEKGAFVRAVRQAIEELPERPRMVYKLSRLEGLTYREIANVLEISPKTVETHMSRALDFLRERLIRHVPLLAVVGFMGNLLP